MGYVCGLEQSTSDCIVSMGIQTLKMEDDDLESVLEQALQT
jgi:PleD family two-component response regulator